MSSNHPGRWPDFFIVGAPRAGTTSLYHYLRRHPDLFMPAVKEPHFFAQIRPVPEQSHLFPAMDEQRYLRLFKGARDHLAVGEASPSYLVTTEAARRIQERVPHARIIILLRDPVERAFSHYLMDVRDGLQTLPFYEALVKDYQAPRKEWGAARLYVEEGRYHDSIKRYAGSFGAGNVAVFLCEGLALNANLVVSHVLEFLGLDPGRMAPLREPRIYNGFSVSRNGVADWIVKSKWARKYAAPLVPPLWRSRLVAGVLHKPAAKPPLDPRAVSFLRELLTPDLDRLEEFLGQKLPFFRTRGAPDGRIPPPRHNLMPGSQVPGQPADRINL